MRGAGAGEDTGAKVSFSLGSAIGATFRGGTSSLSVLLWLWLWLWVDLLSLAGEDEAGGKYGVMVLPFAVRTGGMMGGLGWFTDV